MTVTRTAVLVKSPSTMPIRSLSILIPILPQTKHSTEDHLSRLPHKLEVKFFLHGWQLRWAGLLHHLQISMEEDHQCPIAITLPLMELHKVIIKTEEINGKGMTIILRMARIQIENTQIDQGTIVVMTDSAMTTEVGIMHVVAQEAMITIGGECG
jgi:hypothetical protein